jgi:hypothetical protein
MKSIMSAEAEKRIELYPYPEEVTAFFNIKDPILQRIKYYNEMVGNRWGRGNILFRDGNMYFSTCSMVIRKSSASFYTKTREKKGFTFDGKKLRIWFGRDINSINISLLATYMNWNWLDTITQEWVTKSILEKILQGKITNPLQVIRAYLKSTRIKASPKFVYDAIRRKTKPLTRINLIRYAPYIKHVDHYILEGIKTDRFKHMDDLIRQAAILDRKIDCQWSEKRLNALHHQWTQDIMEVELEHLQEEHYPILEIPDYPKEFRLITTNKELFKEGKSMHNCVYTNYNATVNNSTYIVFHVSLNGEEATLGLGYSKYTEKYTWSQLYCAYNKCVSSNMQEFCKSWFNSLGSEKTSESQILIIGEQIHQF